jgi:hypothetical protein
MFGRASSPTGDTGRTMVLILNGDEIVRLKQDCPHLGLRAGDCGLVWGVYGEQPSMYEATFRRADGKELDHMFAPDEADLAGVTKEQFFAQVEA